MKKEKQTEALYVRCSAELRAKVRKAARLAGLGDAAYVRSVLRRELLAVVCRPSGAEKAVRP